MNEVRTRFAPSPTGFMHVGGVRTALYDYLIAKKNNGKFILRIEDTDQGRYVEGALDVIYSTLKDLGLNWDEGPDIGGEYGPYIQSERKNNYLDYAKKLVEDGNAYYCFCSEERLEELKTKCAEEGIPYKYDGTCKELKKEEVEEKLKSGEKYVIRFNMPTTGSIGYDDLVYGRVDVNNEELEDLILIKSDGMPTYNFANVIDDHEMNMTHIVRGNEYLSSTPKYLHIYRALGWDTPKFVHVPVIKKSAGSDKKLSKRDSDATVEDLKGKGYLNEAIINALALTGWSPGGEEELFTLEELIRVFDIKGISKGNAVFDKEKLNWINGQYIRKSSLDYITDMTIPFLLKEGLVNEEEVSQKKEWIGKIVEATRGKVDYLSQIPEHAKIFFGDAILPENEEAAEVLKGEQVPELLKVFAQKVEEQDTVDVEFGKGIFKVIQKETGIKGKNLFMPIRVALTGQVHGPEMYEIIDILGKEKIINRINAVLGNI